MQKAKVGDLIYSDRDYWRVTEVGPKFVDAQRLRTGAFYEIYHGDYQIVFSPHADQLQKAILDGGEEGFAAKVNELFPPDIGGKAAQEPERAIIGDKVQGLGGFRELGATPVWRVVRLWSGGVFVDVGVDGHDMYLPDGHYVVVERASGKPKREYWGPQLTADTPNEYESHRPEPLTSELVAMLAKREGFTRMDLPYASDKLYWTRQSDDGMLLPWVTEGPCTILVIPEAAK